MTFEKTALREMSEDMMDGLFGDERPRIVVIGGDALHAAYAAQVLATIAPDVVIVSDNGDVTAAFDDGDLNLLDDSGIEIERYRMLRPHDLTDIGTLLKREVKRPVVDYPRWRQLQDHPRSIRKGKKGR